MKKWLEYFAVMTVLFIGIFTVSKVWEYFFPQDLSSVKTCSEHYDPCVPDVDYDIDCPDIDTSVEVIGTDVYNFDLDRDGYGCELN